MMLYSYINQNIQRIRKEIAFGLLPCSLLRHWEIFLRYDAYRKMGHSVNESVFFTSSDMRVTDRTVFSIVKKMQKEI